MLIWTKPPYEQICPMPQQQGSITVPIKTTRHEKQRSITVCLDAQADGTKIKPFAALPCTEVKANVAALSGAVVKCSTICG